MRADSDVWLKAAWLAGRPDVGMLMSLCEENYRRLLCLAPQLRHASGSFVSRRSGVLDLHLDILEQAPYTTLLRLTHAFACVEGAPVPPRHEPDARLRLYHDARQVEIIELHQSAWPLRRAYRPPALAHKWQANLFLGKWLAYCLAQGHGFMVVERPTKTPAPASLT